MAAKSIKAFSLFAIIISVSGIAFALFMENSSGKLESVLNIGATGVETFSMLIIPIGAIFLYHSFR